MHKLLPLLLLAAACGTQAPIGHTALCDDVPDAPEPDAPDPDAPPDAPPPAPLDLVTPWPRVEIYKASLLGADGIQVIDLDGDGRADLGTTGWEQSGKVTLTRWATCTPAGATVELPGTTSAVEDSALADLDGDGNLDTIASGSGGFRLHARFGPALADALTPALWTSPLTIGTAQRYLRAVAKDFDGNGHVDVIAGGYSTGATIDIYRSTTPRTAGSWTREVIGRVGAVMNLSTHDIDGDGDLDLLVSDRDTTTYKTDTNGDGVIGAGDATTYEYDKLGVRYLLNPGATGGAWVNVPIWVAGDMKWHHASADGRTIVAGKSNSDILPPTACPTEIRIYTTLDGVTWSYEVVPTPANVGCYQAAVPADLDGDGAVDIAITHSNADDDRSGAVWMRRVVTPDPVTGGPVVTWERGEVSGVDGRKYDNLALSDVDCDGDADIITTEEGKRGDLTVIPLGLVAYLNPF